MRSRFQEDPYLQAGGDPRNLLLLKPIGEPRDGITHVQAIPRTLATAFRWIYDGMPPV